MYCPSCGTPLALQTRYCNRCGAQLNSTEQVDLIKLFERRMDSEMEGLFYITILGIGLILGGIALMKKVLNLNDWIIIAYLVLSALAFISYFGLGVWQVLRLARSAREASGVGQLAQSGTQALNPPPQQGLPSVTENTTRTLEPIPAREESVL